MFCCRILCFLLLLLGTAAAACACFFPLFERAVLSNVTESAASSEKQNSLRVYAWYMQQKTNKEYYEQVYTRDIACSRAKMMTMATAVSTAVAVAFGVIGTLVASGSLSYRDKRCCPCCSTFLFSLLAFTFLVVPVALSVILYTKSSCNTLDGTSVEPCVSDGNCSYDAVKRFLLYETTRSASGEEAVMFPALKQLGFPIKTAGFCCLCGAAGGMLISTLLSLCA